MFKMTSLLLNAKLSSLAQIFNDSTKLSFIYALSNFLFDLSDRFWLALKDKIFNYSPEGII